MVLRLSLYSSQSVLWYSDYPYTHHSLPGGTQTIPLLITVCLIVQRLYLYSSQSPWWFPDYTYSHHSLFGGTQTIYILITVPLVSLRISLYSSQSIYWLRQSLYPLQSPWWYSDYPFTNHSLSGGPQTISILITVYLVAQLISILIRVTLVVLRLSLYSSLSLWWYSDYLYTHHSLSGNTGISDRPFTHHSLPGGTQPIPMNITVSQVVLRLSLHPTQSTWWYSDYPYSHHRFSGGTQTIRYSSQSPGGTKIILIHITVSLVVQHLTLYS